MAWNGLREQWLSKLHVIHCVIRNFCGPRFPACEQNTERYRVRTRKTPNTDTFHVVIYFFHVTEWQNFTWRLRYIYLNCNVYFFLFSSKQGPDGAQGQKGVSGQRGGKGLVGLAGLSGPDGTVGLVVSYY